MGEDETVDVPPGLPWGLSIMLLLTSIVWSALSIALADNAAHVELLEKFRKIILIAAAVMTAAGAAGAGISVARLLRGFTDTTWIIALWLWANAAFCARAGLWHRRFPPTSWPGPEIYGGTCVVLIAMYAVAQWRGRRQSLSGKFSLRSGAPAVAMMLALAMPSLCRADSLSLPLQGYFHPGRAMPVAWEISHPASLEITADEAIRCRVESGNTRGIAAILTLDRDLGDIQWRTSGASPQRAQLALHPVEDSQYLVASETDDPALTHQLFPGRSIVPIVLDGAAVQGPAMAWEALDGLVLSPVSYARLSPDFCRGLLAGGVTLAVTGDAKPAGPWPWRKGAGLWMAASQLPLPSIFNADVYAPIWGWSGGRSAGFRIRIVLLGALFCLAACGVGLWRSGWMPAGMLLWCAVAMLMGFWINARQSPVMSVSGAVRLAGLPVPLADVWFYQQSHRDCQFSVPVSGLVQPFASDRRQLQIGQLALSCDAAGEPVKIEGSLRADSPLCLMSRGIDSAMDPGPLTKDVTSPLRLLARGTVYPEFRLNGEVVGSAREMRWGTVVMGLRE